MAEPVYPNLQEEKSKPRLIGFEGLVPEPSEERQKVDDRRIRKTPSPPSTTEDVALVDMDTQNHDKAQHDDNDQDTVYFKDGVRKIDVVITYKDRIDKKGTEQEIAKSSERRKVKREAFFQALSEKGLEFEYQEPKYYDNQTWFVKVHATFPALEEGAEELLLRMPIKEVDLPRKDKSFYRDIFTKLKIRDPFEFFDPKIPAKFKYKDCFTAPYVVENRKDYLGSNDEQTFFSSAQRSYIVWNILENTHYGEAEDQVGISRLLQNNSFTSAYILHDGDFLKKGDEYQNERQLLFYEWASPFAFYKYQPLENIRHYFGEKVGLYFAWTGFYTSWLLMASIVGFLIMFISVFTLANTVETNQFSFEICSVALREFFYMCPLCDDTCDFWYYSTSCGFARISGLFDYAGTITFAAFMACWAVLFLEFWKRKESQLQYEWDTLGFEEAEQRERPEFVQSIKRKIKDLPEDKKKRYRLYNPVLERYEYIQPAFLVWPKLCLGVSILATMVMMVIIFIFAIVVYRLAISTIIYRIVQRLPGGPSAADLIVSISASCLQLVFIVIMNQIYERVATWLTNWELRRTDTEYEDSFTYKMYIFQFINFYSSLIYIAFLKGKFAGFPGQYGRIGPYRLDECSTYGCLMELTIQLAIIFLGKQILNDITELGIPYAKTILKKLLRYRKERGKEVIEDDSFVRWEKDFELIPLSIHGLFFEYLELVIQYGFVTIFVAAFPLAPFFAWVNNVIEIRLDAHKFIQVFRRPLSEKAQDIGAWFNLLRFVTKFCIVTNALLIALTSNQIDKIIYNTYYSNISEYEPLLCPGATEDDRCHHGFVTWATSEFPLMTLLDRTFPDNNITAFPVYSAHDLDAFVPGTTDKITVNGTDQLYLPWIDFGCLEAEGFTQFNNETTLNLDQFLEYSKDEMFQSLVLSSQNRTDINSFIEEPPGKCFKANVTCRFRGQVDQNGEYPLKYWRVWTAKLAFIIIFENLLLILGIALDAFVPDVPQSVQNEIRREKLLSGRLANKAKHTGRERANTRASEPAQPIEP